MYNLKINKYFPFNRVKLIDQRISEDGKESYIKLEANKRYSPKCHICGTKVSGIHSVGNRNIRDLNICSTKVFLESTYRKVLCKTCNRIVVEDLAFFDPYSRITNRLAASVYDLCKVMSIKDVAKYFDLNWKTVKAIDKKFLEQEYKEKDYDNISILAVDEISTSKGHHYLTIVLNYITGRIIYVGKERNKETLDGFFSSLTEQQRESIEAIAIDMWEPYINSIKRNVPNAQIVFDLFHVVSSFGKVIDKVRNMEYKKASEEDKNVIKGSKYLLLSNKSNIRKKEPREQLNELLSLNEPINILMILKDKLKHIWDYKSRSWAINAIEEWCKLAKSVDYEIVHKFATMLEKHSYGILSHCDYPIHTSRIEGFNNKIKLIKRKAYGFHDTDYFGLKIIQAFDNQSEFPPALLN